MKHNVAIMVCTHVIEDGLPVGHVEDSIKHDTLICQNCIDKMTQEPFNEKNLPAEVHFACKICVLNNLRYRLKKIT
ncbi:MAG: hypothetical protein GTN97_08585 [Nitrosopumilaceae archaeon]|nr:hypothetical protein [Nitrosopumilaceae archaeon]